MDIIKALEDYNYYHFITEGRCEEWEAWKEQAGNYGRNVYGRGRKISDGSFNRL